jgi:hypothetical protein
MSADDFRHDNVTGEGFQMEYSQYPWWAANDMEGYGDLNQPPITPVSSSSTLSSDSLYSGQTGTSDLTEYPPNPSDLFSQGPMYYTQYGPQPSETNILMHTPNPFDSIDSIDSIVYPNGYPNDVESGDIGFQLAPSPLLRGPFNDARPGQHCDVPISHPSSCTTSAGPLGSSDSWSWASDAFSNLTAIEVASRLSDLQPAANQASLNKVRGDTHRVKRKPHKKANGKSLEDRIATPISYCSLKLFEEWVQDCRSDMPGDVRQSDYRSRFNGVQLRCFEIWAAEKAKEASTVRIKICPSCFHTYGEFYTERLRSDQKACKCEWVTPERRAGNSDIPKTKKFHPIDEPKNV